MQILVQRLWKNDQAVIGTFSVDGVSRYFSLELPELFEGEPNVPDKCCIPAATYDVQRLWSNHFGRMMPHIVDVPGRSAIEIHVANYPSEILGCMAIGELRLTDTTIGNSQQAFDEFNADFEAALANSESVTITIE